MSEIIQYGFEQTRDFMDAVAASYANKITESLPFEEWKCRFLPRLASGGKAFGVTPYKLGSPIRVAPTGVQMQRLIEARSNEIQEIEFNVPIERQDYEKTQLFKDILKPVMEFSYDTPITVPGMVDNKPIDVPIWFNTTLKSVNIRPGFANLDSAFPACLPLSDAPVHAMLGGRTGAGKSVLLNDIIVSLLYEYPPWEIDILLADFKVVELSRYANRIPTPHVSIVAATGSTEFALSLFQSFIGEMKARQAVFTAVGVQNLKSFREKFNLVLPRQVLIADEFVQMYQNIKIAAQEGNDKADEQKVLINSAISAAARLGRSQGEHMLLSSQDMDGVLDEQTSGQFAGGITLGATASVSNTLIGNAAGSTIQGKGKGYLNLNKAGKDVKDNTIVWVPFIPDSISEEDAAAGKMSYLQESLLQIKTIADKFNWKRTPYFYNEDETIARRVFEDHKRYSYDKFTNPQEETPVHTQIYRETAFARLPLGKEIAYTDRITYDFTLKRRKRHNLIIGADQDINKVYIAKLLAEGLSMYPGKHVIIAANRALYLQIGLDNILKDVEIQQMAEPPLRYMTMVKSRTQFLTLQAYLTQNGCNGPWDNHLVFKYLAAEALAKVRFPAVTMAALLKYAEERNFMFHDITDIKAEAERAGLPTDESSTTVLDSVLSSYVLRYNTLKQLTNGFQHVCRADCFNPIVIWWVGADEIPDIEDSEMRRQVSTFLESSCQVNIFNILIAEKWNRLTALAGGCNFVLEKCSKQFFLDVDMPRDININKNSFQVHDREARTRNIVRMFNI